MSDVSPPANYRGWEYAKKGDYHRNLDPNWSYTPTYLRKVRFVEDFVNALPRSTRILDVGCGEGVLVESFHARGWTIAGVDANYANDLVRRGDACNLPHEDQSFDLVMLLDVLEHIGFNDQSQALSEISRVLRPDGYFLMSVPNLAHFNSRVRLFFKGKLDRTDAETDHIGERPIGEHKILLEKCGFSILDCVGLTFSLPLIYRGIICKNPARFRWLHDALEPFAAIFPALAMFDVFVCRKTRGYTTTDLKTIRGPAIRRIGDQLGGANTMLESEGANLLKLSSISGKDVAVLVTGATQGARSHWIAKAAEAGRRVYVTDISDRQWVIWKAGSRKESTAQSVEPIDVLIIGRDPSYEAVSADLHQWLPKLKDGGTVVFHDFAWAEGVQRAVRELVVPYQVEGGRQVDSIYWTRIRKATQKKPVTKLLASVIIPTYSRPDYLKDAVESVQGQSLRAEDYEICVVDNGPKGEAKEVVEEINKCGRHEVRYIREPRTGLHNARHAGARAAQGEILVYIDDDVIVPSSWLEAIVTTFGDARVACVAGKTVPKWEGEQPEWLNQFWPVYLSLLDLGDSVQELQWPQGAYGCNMAIRRSVLYELGGFNPDGMGDRRLIWYRGDGETGLHKKIYDAGYKVIYVPEAWLYHRMPQTRLQLKSFYWRLFIQGISDSYSHAREYPSRYRMIRHSARCFINAALTYWKSIQGGHHPLFDRANVSYWYGRGQHQLRVAMNRKLYDHVLADTYFLE